MPSKTVTRSKTITVPSETIDSMSALVDKVGEWYAGNHSVLFRGHRCNDWSLTPRLARITFRNSDSASFLDKELKMQAEFERLSAPHLDGQNLNAWDRLALAQHHGLPTRLLDWSSNPLVALWFAVEQPAEPGKDAVVWAYDIDEDDFVTADLDPHKLQRTMIFRPRHHDSRIVAQAGWFTIHKNTGDRLSSLDKITRQRKRLRKFLVPRKHFPAIRDDLGRCGVHRAALFPDLGGLCRHLLWQYECLPDEHDYDDSNGSLL